MYSVYILTSQKRKNWSYVGYTGNLKVRLGQHNRGNVISTKGFRPLILVYQEEFLTELGARDRELYLKSGQGREDKCQIIEDYHANYSGIVCLSADRSNGSPPEADRDSRFSCLPAGRGSDAKPLNISSS